MKSFWIILSLAFTLLLAGFAVQNSEPVKLDFWFWQVHLPLFVIIFSAIAFGVLITTLVNVPGYFSKRKQISNLKKKSSKLEQEVNELKVNRYELGKEVAA